MSRLIVHRTMRLHELVKATGLTAGNASAHLTVLEEAGYVARRRDQGKVEAPATVAITEKGDASFRGYVRQVRQALAPFEDPAF